ncbi:MAG: hypothetical protein JWP81_8 [Ferruginibacter sp.]|nr:hypothetical protein [Ferruginibacter sp.]
MGVQDQIASFLAMTGGFVPRNDGRASFLAMTVQYK